MTSDKVLDNLRRQCSKREYCTADVRKKAIRALDGDEAQAEKVVCSLLEERYVDDLRYAGAYVRDKSSLAGWGVAKIRYMLGLKGVAHSVIDAALQEIDDTKASSKLEKLLENKYRSLRGDPQCRLKLIRYGLGRGYTYDELAPLVSGLLKELKCE